MVTALDKALQNSRALFESAYTAVYQKAKMGAWDGFDAPMYNGMDSFQTQGGNRQRYAQFRGWVHSAINALALEACAQNVFAGRLLNKPKDGSKPKTSKSALLLPASLRKKTVHKELDIDPDHELLPILEQPNKMQGRTEFVYSFVANLCLTGWAYIVVGKDKKGKMEFFSIPTTWVEPDHTQGAFSKFKIRNPNNPGGDYRGATLDRSQVWFAYFPNPADPMAALSLTQAQSQGIKIDDSIQSSQSLFFDNGVFPSVIVSMGANPHPDFPDGVVPRLNAIQRRQVNLAIKKVMSGVANYGNPAIVDGLIGKIERLSATQTEMGWEKSEKSVRTRILSAFGVHPFILGEEMAGSYAQAYNVERRFCKRVNAFLNTLSALMTRMCSAVMDDSSLVVWWEEAKAEDPTQENAKWQFARKNNDITQNEYRQHMLGLSPDEDGYEIEIDRASIGSVTQVALQVAKGAITPEQGQAILEGTGLPPELAQKIAGEAMQQGQQGQQGGQQGQQGGQQPGMPPGQSVGQQNPMDQQSAQQSGNFGDGGDPGLDEEDSAFALASASKALELAAKAILITPEHMAESIIRES